MRSNKIGMVAVTCVAAVGLASCSSTEKVRYDEDKMVETLKYLSSDEMEGRQTGQPGNVKAREFLIAELSALGIQPMFETYEQPFDFTRKLKDGSEAEFQGVNLIGMVKGTNSTAPSKAAPTMVVTAHFDHHGIRGGQVMNGADDNASGTAGLLALAESFKKRPPEHDTIFALLDAEEMGLKGAEHFVNTRDSLSGQCVAFNLNMDMVSRNDKNELYAAGGYHYPKVAALLNAVVSEASVDLKLGHDRPELGIGDWTLQSDHAHFHRVGIPFVYFGVEDHPHYHKPTDDFDTLPIDFYKRAVATIEVAARRFNEDLLTVGAQCD